MSDKRTTPDPVFGGTITEVKVGKGWKIVSREINGISFNLINPKTHDFKNAMRCKGLQLMLNDMNDRLEVDSQRMGRIKPLDDSDLSIIKNRLKDYGLKGEVRITDAMVELACENRYHPVKKYLDSLTWDGKDYFAALMNKIETTSPIADVFVRKFLIGSIAKALGQHQNFMLVLLGGQGKGKSRLVEWLCPLSELFNEGPIHPEDKDYLIKLMDHWIWEVAELDATTRKADRSALKHFISTRNINVRVPFGKFPVIKPSVASMIGTVNPDGTGFLSDPSGNRRFGVVTIEDIDWSYEDIDKGQLWAQLYAAYNAGELWELTYPEQAIQAEINIEHSSASPLEMLFHKYFIVDKGYDGGMQAMDILAFLEDNGLKTGGKQHTASFDLAAVLMKSGAKKKQRRVDGSRQWLYVGVKKNDFVNEIKEL